MNDYVTLSASMALIPPNKEYHTDTRWDDIVKRTNLVIDQDVGNLSTVDDLNFAKIAVSKVYQKLIYWDKFPELRTRILDFKHIIWFRIYELKNAN